MPEPNIVAARVRNVGGSSLEFTIPKPLADKLGLQGGEVLLIAERGGLLVIARAKDLLTKDTKLDDKALKFFDVSTLTEEDLERLLHQAP